MSSSKKIWEGLDGAAHANQFIHLSEGGDHEGGRDHYWGREATGRHDWKRTRIVSIEIETDDGPLVFQITPFAAYDLRAYLAQPSRLVVEWPDARELWKWVPVGETRILHWIYRTHFSPRWQDEWNKPHSWSTRAGSPLHVVPWSDMAGGDDRLRSWAHGGLDMSLGIWIRQAHRNWILTSRFSIL